jgi:hypothetical protein
MAGMGDRLVQETSFCKQWGAFNDVICRLANMGAGGF